MIDTYLQQIRVIGRQVLVTGLTVWVSMTWPMAAMAQEVNSSPSPTVTPAPVSETVESTPTPSPTTGPTEPTGPEEPTGAPACTGAGCYQGLDQGFEQGVDQGGPTLKELGAEENEAGELVLPEGVENTTQGASQGLTQGVDGSGLDAAVIQSGTGAESDNTTTVDTTTSEEKALTNTVDDTTEAVLGAQTGGNSGSLNSGDTAVGTGDANIGVTQIKNDNTAVDGGSVGVKSSGHNGTRQEDLELDFEKAVSLLTDEGQSRSIRAINDTTGQGSTNDVILGTVYEDILEAQNDGRIDNDLVLDAITGQNASSGNTGDGNVETGNANIAATLVNLLNTTVINGNLAVEVHDIFGDLVGDIRIPDLAQLAAVLGNKQTVVNASNEETGSESENSIAVDIEDTETTEVDNDADIDTDVTANAITGQNEATGNTGGSAIDTGDGSVQASNVSVANTTVEGGSWGLVVVNALNRWLGFLVGDNGQTRALTQNETIREIEARNEQTGADSENSITVTDETRRETTVENDAVIDNDVTANAITGQNEANYNTGAGRVKTGDANVLANTVNIANTTVKNANLGIAVVNVFGNWMGDLLYKGASLLAGTGGSESQTAAVQGSNHATGSDSENVIGVNIDRSQETTIENDADIDTVLDANIDTGNNTANKNTRKGEITTGDSLLALHSRAVANVTGVTGSDSLDLTITGDNDTTGARSENTIEATINDERIVNVDNEANVSTVFSGGANTGNNEASRNTGGAKIVTGEVAADVAVEDMINRVLVATGGAGGEVLLSGELGNRVTGAESENSTNVDVTRAFLTDIFNDATVDTLMDLILNTGGNTAEENTGDDPIATGEVCVDGHVTQDVNTTNGVWAANQVALRNKARVNTDAGIMATTGENSLSKNTGGGPVRQTEGVCDRLARVPEPPTEDQQPDDGGENGEDDGVDGNGGGDSADGGDHGDGAGGSGNGDDLPILARVAGTKVAQAAEEKAEQAREVGEQLAATGRNLFSARQGWWALFAVGSALLLTGAIQGDQRQRRQLQEAVGLG